MNNFRARCRNMLGKGAIPPSMLQLQGPLSEHAWRDRALALQSHGKAAVRHVPPSKSSEIGCNQSRRAKPAPTRAPLPGVDQPASKRPVVAACPAASAQAGRSSMRRGSAADRPFRSPVPTCGSGPHPAGRDLGLRPANVPRAVTILEREHGGFRDRPPAGQDHEIPASRRGGGSKA